MSLKLHYQHQGQGAPLLIIHGLFGNLDNWRAQVKALAGDFSVYTLDLRNHGRSPHAPTMTYAEMAADVLALMDQLALPQACVLGHSMGGKVAMQMALSAPERISRLIVADIAPVQYPPHHNDVFEGLFSLPLASIKSRGDADRQLATWVKTPDVRQFLLTNLQRSEQGFQWRINLQGIFDSYGDISAAPQGSTPFRGPTLFIKGEHSDYLKPEYRPAIMERFPNARAKVIQGSGHWPHAEKPRIFTSIVAKFLSE